MSLVEEDNEEIPYEDDKFLDETEDIIDEYEQIDHDDQIEEDSVTVDE